MKQDVSKANSGMEVLNKCNADSTPLQLDHDAHIAKPAVRSGTPSHSLRSKPCHAEMPRN